MKKHLMCLVVLAGLAYVAPAFAAEKYAGLMERWYSALAAAEAEEVAALLSPEARLDLQDIGVVQSGAEFVASMDEWADAIKGGSIRHRIDAEGGQTVDATVCYTFTGSVMMTVESFVFEGGQIVSSIQKTVATSCHGF